MTGKSYIGWSKRVRDRLGWHKSHLRQGKHSRREMQSDFLKHGEESFSFEIVKICADEHEAVREEAVCIGESFKAGLSYNGIVPNATEARPRAERKPGLKPAIKQCNQSETDRLKEIYYGVMQKHKADYLRDASDFWDVMVFLDYQDEEQFFLLTDAFLRLIGKSEAAVCFKAFGNPVFINNIRTGACGPFPCDQAKVAQDYISKEMEQRRQAYKAEAYFAREKWLEAVKAEAAQKERAAA